MSTRSCLYRALQVCRETFLWHPQTMRSAAMGTPWQRRAPGRVSTRIVAALAEYVYIYAPKYQPHVTRQRLQSTSATACIV